jgi:hypothetical protein
MKSLVSESNDFFSEVVVNTLLIGFVIKLRGDKINDLTADSLLNHFASDERWDKLDDNFMHIWAAQKVQSLSGYERLVSFYGIYSLLFSDVK